MTPVLDITTSGRGGGMTYREGERAIPFDWEFAMSPALALIWGPARAHWDAQYPWAAGRQASIYDFVGSEVVRRQVPDGNFEVDLDLGHLTILSTGPRGRARASARAAAAADELRLHVSVDARLAAAEAQAREGRATELADVLAREIRQLNRPEDGLERALRLAAAHPAPAVRQALLWASYNATPCAPACAALLLKLSGVREPFDADITSMLGHLGRHVSTHERDAAFAALSTRLGMVLDQSAQD